MIINTFIHNFSYICESSLHDGFINVQGFESQNYIIIFCHINLYELMFCFILYDIKFSLEIKFTKTVFILFYTPGQRIHHFNYFKSFFFFFFFVLAQMYLGLQLQIQVHSILAETNDPQNKMVQGKKKMR